MLRTLRALRIATLLTSWSSLCVVGHHVLRAVRPSAVARFHLIYFRGVNAILGIRVRCVGEIAPGPLLITANHTSWLDIPIMASLRPLSFVAKREVAGWPVFGSFARWHRSVFIDRERRRSTFEVNTALARRFHKAETVVLFAEGTSGDGNRVLPFKSAVIGAVEHAARHSAVEVHVQPVAVAYSHVNGLIMGRRERAHFAWTGDLDLAPHMWQAFKQGPLDVTIAVGRRHSICDYANRKEMAMTLERECRELLMGTLLTRERAPEPADHERDPGETATG